MERLLSWHTGTALWMVWMSYWAISARKRAPDTSPRTIPLARGLSRPVGLRRYLYSRDGFLGQRFAPDRKWVEVVGLVLVLAGFALSIWARLHLGQFWSTRVALKVDHQLIRSGPYASRASPHLYGTTGVRCDL